MTARGKPASSLRPTTPPDPTLTTRPVPKTRVFTLHSFGPGAAPNIRDLVRKLEDVRAESDPTTHLNRTNANIPDEGYQLLKEVAHSETILNGDEVIGVDPTWGFYAFVVDYDADTLEKIPQVMQNLIDVTHRYLRAVSTTAYTAEAIRRFRLDVVQDKELLSGASDDRIREEFWAHLRRIRHLGGDGVIRGGVRNNACMVLDRVTVCMLAGLSFLDDLRGDYPRFKQKTIKLVDAQWVRPATNVSAYRGVDYIQISSLVHYYIVCDWMEDVWPMEKLL